MQLRLIIICLLLSSSLFLDGQILSSRYSHYANNGLMLNPAYAGSYDGTSYTGFYRNQWSGIEGAPVSILLTAHTRSDKWERVGLGGFIENDKIGLTNRINAFGTFSYSIPTDNGTISAGFQGGVQFYASDLENCNCDPRDIELYEDNQLLPNFGAGLYYYTDDWYIGAAIPYLVEEADFYTGVADVKTVDQTLQILTTAGYVLSINDNLAFKPTMLLRVLPKSVDKIQTEVSGNVMIKETFWLGLSTRLNTATLESAVLLLGADFPTGLRIGYSYDYGFSNSGTGGVFASSHEVMVGYDIPKSTRGGKEPRYF